MGNIICSTCNRCRFWSWLSFLEVISQYILLHLYLSLTNCPYISLTNYFFFHNCQHSLGNIICSTCNHCRFWNWLSPLSNYTQNSSTPLTLYPQFHIYHEMFFIYNYSHLQYSFCNQPVLFAQLKNVRNYGTTTAPCMWTNEIKTKTKSSHVTLKLTTRFIVRFSPQAMQWYP